MEEKQTFAKGYLVTQYARGLEGDIQTMLGKYDARIPWSQPVAAGAVQVPDKGNRHIDTLRAEGGIVALIEVPKGDGDTRFSEFQTWLTENAATVEVRETEHDAKQLAEALVLATGE